MKVRVKCTFFVDVDIDGDTDLIKFMIEENSCPGTGAVGVALDRAIEYANANGVCWACNLNGENEIIREEA